MGGQSPNMPGKANALSENIFSNPLLALSASLLEAGQPSTSPQSVGKGLSKGFGLASEMARQQREEARKREELESAKALRQAQMQKYAAEAAKEKLFQDYISGNLGEQTGSPKISESDVRKYVGLSEETPEMKQKRELETAKLKKQQEQEFPTQTTKTRQETMIETAPSLFEGLEKVIDKGRFFPGYSKHIKGLGETFATFKNYPKGEGSIKLAISVLQPSLGEVPGVGTYEERIKDQLYQIAPSAAKAYQERGLKVPDIVKKYLNKAGNEQKLQQEAEKLGISMEAIKHTAQKHNMTPQKVIEEYRAQRGL